ncbi:MAG TPA: hypothetical protein VHB93_02170 [Candidatus Paceibacterota bacterium]|nr:hypothetical protein [Candidatus Paceibacterota bacterium]
MTGSNRTIRRKPQRGFALLVAIVLSSIAAVITFSLASLAYKNLLLASDATQSQFAFYAADSALECALQADKGNVSFQYQSNASPHDTTIKCEGRSVTLNAGQYNGTTVEYYSNWFYINTTDPSNSSITRCAKLTVYKDVNNTTSIYAEGLNLTCDAINNPRILERGIKATYGS